jgi:hypothetical protein
MCFLVVKLAVYHKSLVSLELAASFTVLLVINLLILNFLKLFQRYCNSKSLYIVRRHCSLYLISGLHGIYCPR